MYSLVRVFPVVATITFLQLGNVVATFYYDTYSFYLLREQCEGTPNRVDSYVAGGFEEYLSCDNTCNDSSSSWKSHSTVCGSTDYTKDMSKAFGNSSYLLQEAFESDCETFRGAVGFLASGDCEQITAFVYEWGFSVYEKIQTKANGAVVIQYFTDQTCETPLNGSIILTFQIDAQDTEIDQALLSSTTCDENDYRWTYYSATTSSDSISSASNEAGNASIPETMSLSSGNNTKAIVAIVGGGIVAVVLLLVVLFVYRRRGHEKQSDENTTNYNDELTIPIASTHVRTSSLTADRVLLGQSGLWSDDVITAKKVPRQDIDVRQLISRGAYGEVYEGIFNDQRVAVKMLSPETRSIISYVNSFLAEAKLSATMDHPNIVTFIAVAWNSPSDLCIVLEFMEGGDLRTLLNTYKESNHPVGIDLTKAKIAFQVCHALTYLHSLAPPVIHRDLKSRNILLTHDLEAKLTDFGVSRERVDTTMTAGVGTSLWMAPEVMLGKRYNDKADMFSFGVVLSELDWHALPYSQNRAINGMPRNPALISHQVAVGNVRVEFSNSNPSAITNLGEACVSMDPNHRPTAAEALYTLQTVLTEGFS